jgi:4,5-DOPA dioxygenase extradiol
MNKMPALFVGHGSPMNAIEDNEYTRKWQQMAHELPRPEAILSVSAHWVTRGTRVMDEPAPKMIYDMYGFPDELYRVTYPAKGAPETALLAKGMIKREVKADNSWGYDHGTWSVLSRMFPKADIPVFQLSLDSTICMEEHYRTGRELSALRNQGVMIFGSGNVVHNLSRVSWGMKGGQPWAVEFDSYILGRVENRVFDDVVNYRRAGQCSELAFYTPEHFQPLLYVLAASDENDKLTVFNNSCTMGSMSMTSYLFA